MPSAKTAARKGRHFLRTVDIATLFADMGRGPAPRVGERALRTPDGPPTEWTARSGQTEARPRRRKPVLTRKWHTRFPQVSEPVRQESKHPVQGLPDEPPTADLGHLSRRVDSASGPTRKRP